MRAPARLQGFAHVLARSPLPGAPLPACCAAEYASSVPGTPQLGSPMGGAAAASPEGSQGLEGSPGMDGGQAGGSKRRLSGGLRRLRSALQEFATAFSNGAGTSGATGMRP